MFYQALDDKTNKECIEEIANRILEIYELESEMPLIIFE
jgi:hypothetical protein